MPSITPYQPATAGQTLTRTGANAELGGMGKDQFLKILVGQLQHQDPMNPSSDQDFVGQMAQFSMVEQVSNLAQTMKIGQSMALIGKTVTYKNADGTTATGVVEKVTIDGQTPKLTVGDATGIDSTAVTEVK